MGAVPLVTVMAAGPFCVATVGVTVVGVSAPVASMLKAETLVEPTFATYANFPDGSTVTEAGPNPAGNGDPATTVNAPVVALMLKAETLLELSFATYANLPEGSTVTESGPVPAAT